MPEREALVARLTRWISSETSLAVAEQFVPWLTKTLWGHCGHDPNAAIGAEEFEEVKSALYRADLSPARLKRAVVEARRARREGLSTLQWARALQTRAFGEAIAEGAFQRALARLKQERAATEEELQAPPTPKETLAYLLAWEELGGASDLAALRELRRQQKGGLPQN